LELLHELFPTANVVAVLVNPSNPAVADATANQMLTVAHTLGVELHVLNASTESDFDAVFTKVGLLLASGLVVGGGDPFFVSQSRQLAALAAQHAVPLIGAGREFVVEGGLIGYGADIVDTYRLTGVYVGRILKGEKPADLPVQLPVKFEMALNAKTAKALGLTVP
jgi:putative ABC transport system substrate-binding protein